MNKEEYLKAKTLIYNHINPLKYYNFLNNKFIIEILKFIK